MREFIFGIHFKNKDGDIISERDLKNKWVKDLSDAFSNYYDFNAEEEISIVLMEQLKAAIDVKMIKEMIEEINNDN